MRNFEFVFNIRSALRRLCYLCVRHRFVETNSEKDEK